MNPETVKEISNICQLIQDHLMAPRNIYEFNGEKIEDRVIEHSFVYKNFNASIQASEFHYCSPRTNAGPWVEVEVGYPNMDLLGIKETEDCIYAYLDIEVLAASIYLATL